LRITKSENAGSQGSGQGVSIGGLRPGRERSPAGRSSVDDGVVPTESDSLLESRIDWDDRTGGGEETVVASTAHWEGAGCTCGCAYGRGSRFE
jgi:hypothetical protein